jgi:hemerythrin-like domain-containing protein
VDPRSWGTSGFRLEPTRAGRVSGVYVRDGFRTTRTTYLLRIAERSSNQFLVGPNLASDEVQDREDNDDHDDDANDSQPSKSSEHRVLPSAATFYPPTLRVNPDGPLAFDKGAIGKVSSVNSCPVVAETEVGMDALSLLKEDHDKVKKMLQDLESTTERGVKTREELFTNVKRELEVHEAIEEEIFYPALKDQPKTKEIALEAYEEHHVVDKVMAEIEGVSYDDERWGAKFKVMKENLEHHIEEEEGEMFKQAKQVFETTELAQLGESMLKRKEELIKQQSATDAESSR